MANSRHSDTWNTGIFHVRTTHFRTIAGELHRRMGVLVGPLPVSIFRPLLLDALRKDRSKKQPQERKCGLLR